MSIKMSPLYYILRLWYVVVALLIVASAVVLRVRANEMPEHVSIPNPAMPSPNARDYYSAAENLMREREKVDMIGSEPTSITKKQEAVPASNRASGDHTFTQAEKDQLVAENQPAIAKLREGMKYQYMAPPARSFTTMMPYYAHDRAMARLLSLQGQTQVANGDWKGAMESYLDSIKLGSDLPHGATLIGLLVGIACDAIGRKYAYAAVDHLSAGQARLAARRLAEIDEHQEPFSQTLQEEEWGTQASLVEVFSKRNWRKNWAEIAGTQPSYTSLSMRLESPKTAYDNITQYMNAEAGIAKLPWPQQRAAKQPPIPTDPMNQVMLPEFTEAGFKHLSTIALDRLLETQLGLRAYKLDHGHYPSSLDALVPEYLPSVPTDPFADQALLRYKLEGGKYMLYSIGPDAVDDGGKPIYDPAHKPSYGVLWSRDEKGDIVAGVNS